MVLDSRDLPPRLGNSVATLLSYLVKQAGGMIILPSKQEIIEAVRGMQLHMEEDAERGTFLITLVPSPKEELNG